MMIFNPINSDLELKQIIMSLELVCPLVATEYNYRSNKSLNHQHTIVLTMTLLDYWPINQLTRVEHDSHNK